MVICHHINITITKMVEIVEELMIAVLGGSAEIVGWPEKVVLCAAGVSISLHCRGQYFSMKKTTSNPDKSIFTGGLNIVQTFVQNYFPVGALPRGVRRTHPVAFLLGWVRLICES